MPAQVQRPEEAEGTSVCIFLGPRLVTGGRPETGGAMAPPPWEAVSNPFFERTKDIYVIHVKEVAGL